MKILVIDTRNLSHNLACTFSVNTSHVEMAPIKIMSLLKEEGLSAVQEFYLSKLDGRDADVLAFVHAEGPFSKEVSTDTLPRSVQKEIENYKLYKKAISFAVEAHGDQPYAEGLPYSFHLKQTDKVIDRFFYELPSGKTMVLKAAAWLHDVLEDTPKKASEVEAIFGREILGVVQKLTKKNEVDTVEFEEGYYAGIAEDPLAVIGKMADKCANAKQTLKNSSAWHAKRIVGGHSIFQQQAYGEIQASGLKTYLDFMILKLNRLFSAPDAGRPSWRTRDINYV